MVRRIEERLSIHRMLDREVARGRAADAFGGRVGGRGGSAKLQKVAQSGGGEWGRRVEGWRGEGAEGPMGRGAEGQRYRG